MEYNIRKITFKDLNIEAYQLNIYYKSYEHTFERINQIDKWIFNNFKNVFVIGKGNQYLILDDNIKHFDVLFKLMENA